MVLNLNIDKLNLLISNTLNIWINTYIKKLIIKCLIFKKKGKYI